MIRRPPRSTRLPYTTLFRARRERHGSGLEQLLELAHRAEDPEPLVLVDVVQVAHREDALADDGLVVRRDPARQDRKSTRLNSSHANISYAVFCLTKNNQYCS